MSVTTPQVARAGGRAPRSQISGQQFTEVLIGGLAGSVAASPVINSSVKIIQLKSWSPPITDLVRRAEPITLNFEAVYSEMLSQRWTTNVNYDVGTFINARANDAKIELAAIQGIELWDETADTGNWTKRTSAAATISSSAEDGKVRYNATYKTGFWTYDGGPLSAGIEIRGSFYGTSFNSSAGLIARVTGAGTACRGYRIEYRFTQHDMILTRITGDGTTALITQFFGAANYENKWFNMAYKITEDHHHWYKLWLVGATEPTSWSGGTLNSVHTDNGAAGVSFTNSFSNDQITAGPVTIEAIPPERETSGTWVSEVVDVTPVKAYSFGSLTWDEDLPTGTSLTMEIRWAGGSWLTVTNDGEFPGIDYGEKIEAGTSKTTLEIRASLATTDTYETPLLSNIRLYFEPCRVDQLSLTRDGDDHTTALGNLEHWGQGWVGDVSGGVPTKESATWDDLYLETKYERLLSHLYPFDIVVDYYGHTVLTGSFITVEDLDRAVDGKEFYWSVPPIPRASGNNEFNYTVYSKWEPFGKTYEWNIVDKGSAIHADVKYLVGHAQIDNQPISFVLAIPIIDDHKLSVTANAWKRDTHPLSAIIQGWKLDAQPMSYSVGIWTINDHPVSALVALRFLNDHPASLLVYGVNRTGMIEVNIISDATWDELTALGFTRS